MMLNTLISRFSTIGVRISPAQRRIELSITEQKLKGSAMPMMQKYTVASARMASSAPSSAGSGNESAAASTASRTPNSTTNFSACHVTLRASLSRPAPMCWATCTENPTAAAFKKPLNIHVVLAVSPTAAVAPEPSVPTIAVSTYCTIVIMICSTIAGHASEITAIKDVPSGGTPVYCSSRAAAFCFILQLPPFLLPLSARGRPSWPAGHFPHPAALPDAVISYFLY